MDSNEHLDITLLESYLDSLTVDIVQKMLEMYIQQSSIYLEEIASSITNQSQSDWQNSCHKMKGASASIGFLLVHKQLVTLEKSEEQWSVKNGLIAQLITLNEQAIKAFQKWLDTH
ncbi:Hpt domain-containing protein [Thalassotalea piscium]|uniref:HPt (Histidine-containing phosphotransfer) domain-containing protein n=1 Tax=Thalassotalea piscium TaxID=1230533 RepID=A0A7X0TU11_9GAMM|nr:Hpt domain-containing protein [Thalassotalea piscium]MBB6543703.1 HPt (histidine-containing phosphotransfer) domain-containing protein [Thalassotalea piscium]